jgi:hypothetical protein
MHHQGAMRIRMEALMVTDLEKFVAEQNITGYRQWLGDGAEGVTRATLLKLWLRDERILGLTRDQLTRIDRHIEKLRRLIAKQSDSLAPKRADSQPSSVLLATFNDLMATYQVHRQKIIAGLADGKAESK